MARPNAKSNLPHGGLIKASAGPCLGVGARGRTAWCGALFRGTVDLLLLLLAIGIRRILILVVVAEKVDEDPIIGNDDGLLDVHAGRRCFPKRDSAVGPFRDLCPASVKAAMEATNSSELLSKESPL